MQYTFRIFLLLLIVSNSKADGLIDPDTVDSGMPSVSYLIPTEDFAIASYTQGRASHFTVKLCSNCQSKTYPLAEDAELLLLGQKLAPSQLTEVLLQNAHPQLRLRIIRESKTIGSLQLGATKYDNEITSKTATLGENQ